MDCTTIKDLPSNILLKIFYKLPPKQLHRNKIVCKRWSTLISHPSFGPRYLLRRYPFLSAKRPTFTLYLTTHRWKTCFHTQHLTKNEGKLRFKKRKHPFKFIPSNSPEREGEVHCLASSNGLLLCSRTSYLCRCLYYVCNPTTKEWITLPSPPTCKELVPSGIVCNLSSAITQFKVVRIITRPSVTDSDRFNLEIFDSVTKQWKVHKFRYNSPIIFDGKVTPIEHRGILYWECRKSNFVTVFDPNVNRFHLILLPGSRRGMVDHRLGISQNNLYYVEIDFQFRYNSPCTIWKLDQINGIRTFSVHLSLDLFDWTSTKLYYRNKKKMQWQVLGIDPVDSNILYLIFHPFEQERLCSIYSVDVGKRKMKRLYSFRSIGYGTIKSLTFVQPSRPTKVPKLPPLSDDDNLYKTTHPQSCKIPHYKPQRFKI